ncbi:MAG TPA: hypothetical protein PLA68_02780 [Panacibacter sp.]|nr:hypothetical protein [Panacibacter sp.]
MNRKKPGVDVIDDVLKEALEAYPASPFIQSLYNQYLERGGLSKKQLQGLYSKASKIKTLSTAKLATLEAEILKRPNRYKSPLPPNTPLYQADAEAAQLIAVILEKYPRHKRVLFLKNRCDNNELLSAADKAELEKFHKLLFKKQ